MTTQLDFPTGGNYPHSPGWKTDAVETSRTAAEDIKSHAETLRSKCFNRLQLYGPRTADELAGEIGEGILSVRPRISELVRQGRGTATELRRQNASGKSAVVWRAA